MAVSPLPSIPALGELQARLLAGDSAAIDELWSVVAPVLRRAASARFPRVDPAVLESAVEDAFLAHIANPAAFDPALGSLIGWLAGITRNRIIDALRARRRVREVDAGLEPWRESSGEPADPGLEQEEARLRCEALLAELRLRPSERRFLDLLRQEAGLDEQVRALGPSGRSDAPPALRVRRAIQSFRGRAERAGRSGRTTMDSASTLTKAPAPRPYP